jgi:hypothetical protein
VSVEFTVRAPGSDIKEITTYWSWPDGQSEYSNYSTIPSLLPLPKKGLSGSYISTNTPVGGSENWKFNFHVAVVNKQNQTSNSICSINVVVPQTTTTTIPVTTTTTIPATTTTVYVPTFPETPSSSTWKRFKGNGNDIVDVSSIGNDLQIVYVEATGSGNFFTDTLDASLDRISLLVNEIGNFSVIHIVNTASSYGNFEYAKYLEVDSDHSWEFVFKPIASARNFDGSSISGFRSEVIEAYTLNGSKKVLSISHSGSGNVFVEEYDCNGRNVGLLVNEIGNFSGNYVTKSNTCILEIQADGNWTINK